jgi:hypothetical protein
MRDELLAWATYKNTGGTTLWLEMADFREILKIQIENFRSEDSTAFFTS